LCRGDFFNHMFPIMFLMIFPILFSKCSLLLSHILCYMFLYVVPRSFKCAIYMCSLDLAHMLCQMFFTLFTYLSSIPHRLIAPHFIRYSFLKSLFLVVYIRCAKRRGYNAFYLGSIQQFETLFLVMGGGGGGFGF
jgi:hypothetical protein